MVRSLYEASTQSCEHILIDEQLLTSDSRIMVTREANDTPVGMRLAVPTSRSLTAVAVNLCNPPDWLDKPRRKCLPSEPTSSVRPRSSTKIGARILGERPGGVSSRRHEEMAKRGRVIRGGRA